MQWFKDTFYFLAARYFRFWASLVLRRWQPRVIVVTGSSGKTTLLHLLESQFGDDAKISHHANSAFGIPFDVLGLHGINKVSDWLFNLLLAPVRAFSYRVDKPFYIAEVDAERPGEAPFLADLLKPEITLWVNSEITHAMFYAKQMQAKLFADVGKAIAYQYAYIALNTSGLVVADGDNPDVVDSLAEIKTRLRLVKKKDDFKSYKFTDDSTEYVLATGKKYKVPQLLPQDVAYQITMLNEAMEYLSRKPDYNFKNYFPPKGRSSIFKGIKNTKLIDSSYNANLSSIKVMADLFKSYPAKTKWAVIGDMLELGDEARPEHEELAQVIKDMNVDCCILVGRLVSQYTFPILKNAKFKTVAFDKVNLVQDFFDHNLQGGETILFKASQSTHLEFIIKPLLANSDDANKLPRQSDFWDRRRFQKGIF